MKVAIILGIAWFGAMSLSPERATAKSPNDLKNEVIQGLRLAVQTGDIVEVRKIRDEYPQLVTPEELNSLASFAVNQRAWVVLKWILDAGAFHYASEEQWHNFQSLLATTDMFPTKLESAKDAARWIAFNADREIVGLLIFAEDLQTNYASLTDSAGIYYQFLPRIPVSTTKKATHALNSWEQGAKPGKDRILPKKEVSRLANFAAERSVLLAKILYESDDRRFETVRKWAEDVKGDGHKHREYPVQFDTNGVDHQTSELMKQISLRKLPLAAALPQLVSRETLGSFRNLLNCNPEFRLYLFASKFAGSDCLIWSILTKNWALAGELVKQGMPTNRISTIRGAERITPLVLLTAMAANEAPPSDMYALTELLLDYGANPDLCPVDVSSVLDMATQSELDSLVKLFLKHGADPELFPYPDKIHSPFLCAVIDGKAKYVDWMSAHGVNPNRRYGKFQKTPLMIAASQGNQDVVKSLLDAGADPRLSDSLGFTAADYADGGKHYRLAELLERFECE